MSQEERRNGRELRNYNSDFFCFKCLQRVAGLERSIIKPAS
jgi:hypothetical protein